MDPDNAKESKFAGLESGGSLKQELLVSPPEILKQDAIQELLQLMQRIKRYIPDEIEAAVSLILMSMEAVNFDDKPKPAQRPIHSRVDQLKIEEKSTKQEQNTNDGGVHSTPAYPHENQKDNRKRKRSDQPRSDGKVHISNFLMPQSPTAQPPSTRELPVYPRRRSVKYIYTDELGRESEVQGNKLTKSEKEMVAKALPGLMDKINSSRNETIIAYFVLESGLGGFPK